MARDRQSEFAGDGVMTAVPHTAKYLTRNAQINHRATHPADSAEAKPLGRRWKGGGSESETGSVPVASLTKAAG